jgi:hypothetical protein
MRGGVALKILRLQLALDGEAGPPCDNSLPRNACRRASFAVKQAFQA